MLKLLPLLFIFVFASCSHMMRSGQYIMLRSGETPQKIARLYGIQEYLLREANPNTEFQAGEWVFVPLPTGILNGFDPAYILSETEFSWPVPSTKKISSGFGRRWGKSHDGIDIPGRKGTHIIAAADGTVTYSGNGLSGYGNLIIIKHSSGIHTVYAHNQSLYAKKGEKVYRGQVIATLGNTGRSSGPHLHFEVRLNNKAVNPVAYLPPPKDRTIRYAQR